LTFASKLQDFGRQIALIQDGGARITYADLARRADAVYAAPGAPALARALVAIECENTLDTVAGYLGALRNAFPVLLVDATLPVDLRERLYSHFGVSFVWTAAGRWEGSHRASPQVHRDVGVLLSTSGTTGSSKLVKLTPATLQANAESIADYLELDSGERPIANLPIHYSYGLSVLNSHLLVGATVLLTAEPMTQRGFWDFFRDDDATSLAGVPTTYTTLRRLRFEQMSLPSLRTMTQAGGRLDVETMRWFGELAASRRQRFVVMYGQTEASPRMSYVPPERLLDKLGSIGVPIPGGRLDLVAEDGCPIEGTGVTGELRYAGPNVMMGYATDRAELAMPDTQRGVLLSGDLAWRDEDGYFHLAGRLKRFIKVFGNRIGLDDVEARLKEQGLDAAVVGRDDLLVVALRGSGPDADRLATEIAARYRLHRSAIRVAAVETFPMSSSGKIQYAELLGALDS
jgi:long-chain acyl-CoA synthetase